MKDSRFIGVSLFNAIDSNDFEMLCCVPCGQIQLHHAFRNAEQS